MSPLFTIIYLISIAAIAHIAMGGARITTSLYAISLHASAFTIGSLMAVLALFPMILAVPMGRLIDRIGITKPMVGGAIALCLGCALPSITHHLPLMYVAMVLIGIGFMTINLTTQNAVGAFSMTHGRSSIFNWLSMGFSVSSFCGPVLAGIVIDRMQHVVAYLVFCGFGIVVLGMSVFGNFEQIGTDDDQPERESSKVRDLLLDPELKRIYLVGILLASAWDFFIFVMPIHGSDLGISATSIGLILGCFSLSTFVVRLVMPLISRYHSEWRILIGALSLAVICYSVFPFMQHTWSIMIVAGILGLGLGSAQPNMLSLLHQASPPGRLGEATGIRVTINTASQVALPLAFGAVSATLGLFPVFWGMGALIGSGIPLVWRKAFHH